MKIAEKKVELWSLLRFIWNLLYDQALYPLFIVQVIEDMSREGRFLTMPIYLLSYFAGSIDKWNKIETDQDKEF